MKPFKLSPFAFVVIAFIALTASCSDEEEGAETVDFDRKAMLSNLGNNIIIPNYQDLKTRTDALDEAVTVFNDNPNNPNLENLRSAFREAYRGWQTVSVFEFGPAEEELLRISLNTFPTDTTQIRSNIASGDYDLGSASNIDAKGLPALDYLLFGQGTMEETVAQYTTGADANARKEFLAALSNEIKTKVNVMLEGWLSSGGNYIETFINGSGTDAGSSLGLLVNQFNYDFEIIKNAKTGIPLGKKTLGEILPEKVEAYYSGNSAALATLNAQAIENIYLGRSKSGGDGIGLDDYLIHLNAEYNGGMLSDTIKDQFSEVIAKLKLIDDPLSVTIQNNPQVVETAYNEIQETVVLIKADMPSAMGVLITYQDNDGD